MAITSYLNEKNQPIVEKFANVKSVKRMVEPSGRDAQVFPHSEDYAWNIDNFGPLTVPSKGSSIELSTTNLPIYERIIKYTKKTAWRW